MMGPNVVIMTNSHNFERDRYFDEYPRQGRSKKGSHRK